MTGAVYILDKGAGVTSRKAAGKTARDFGFRKYGHCGTLDPDATGLLVVLLGRATRLASYLSGEQKRYSFTLVTGLSTDTLDMSGRVIEKADNSHVTPAMVEKALETVSGDIMQQVPLFSAVRVEGERGYRLARKGQAPEMPVRKVSVSRWKCGDLFDGKVSLEVTVSAGTYVRALARDIGTALGVPSVADSIRRIESGVFNLREASKDPDDPDSLLTMADCAGRVMTSVVLSGDDPRRISHGMAVSSNHIGTLALVDESGRLLATGRGDGSSIVPVTVLVKPEEI